MNHSGCDMAKRKYLENLYFQKRSVLYVKNISKYTSGKLVRNIDL